MTLYGGRNRFRSGYCAPEDIQHNMRMLSDLSDAIGNPFSGGPVWKYPQIDPGTGVGLIDPDGVPVMVEEPLVTSSGLARVQLNEAMVGSGPWPAELLSKDAHSTGQVVSIHDPLGRYLGTTAGSKGYAQNIDNRYEILSIGAQAPAPEAFSDEGHVIMRSGGSAHPLVHWFITQSFDGETFAAPEGRILALMHQNENDVDGKIYITVPEPSPSTTTASEAEITEILKKLLTESPGDVSFIDQYVKVGNGDAPGTLLSKLSSDDDDNTDTLPVVWRAPAVGKVAGTTDYSTNLAYGITKDGGTKVSGDDPGEVDVIIKGGNLGSDTVKTAKLWAYKTPEAGHPVIITRYKDDEWYVIWYGCDKDGS